MPELRWILLVLGVLFIAGLIAWDRARSRRTGEAPYRPHDGSVSVGSSASMSAAPSMGAPVALLPSRATPIPSDAEVPSARATSSASSTRYARPDREIPHDLPVIQVDVDPSIDITFASGARGSRQEPRISTLEVDDLDGVSPSMGDVARDLTRERNTGRSVATADAVTASSATAAVATAAPAMATPTLAGPAAATPATVTPVSATSATAAGNSGVSDTAESPPALRVEWPTDAERRIVAVRVVPRGADRFAGRSVRQALAGEGLRHGPMDIFHAADAEGRVIFSAANLTKPGVFDLATIDAQRFSGLNLFAVLPGPVAPDETFDRLFETARSLSSRLNGELLDHRGEALTQARAAELREGIAQPPP